MSGVSFDGSKHPRDDHGRFSSGGAGNMPMARSLTRGEAWQRIGAKLPAIPVDYTGSPTRELPVASFTDYQFKPQIPKAVSVDDHQALMRGLVGVIKGERTGTIARAQERKLIPEGSDRKTVNRAYNHASMIALHQFGVADYDFKMDDDLKDQMRPLEGFMRYANRRVKDTMLAKHKGQWKPYRAEFGKPFADQRKDKVTGEVRLRMRPNQQLIKSDDEARDEHGRWTAGGVARAVGAAALGAGALALAPRTGRLLQSKSIGAAVKLDRRGTGHIPLSSIFSSAKALKDHIKDIHENPTAVGKTPTGKQLRRQFARDALAVRERLILTDASGKVLHNIKGGALAVDTKKQVGDIEHNLMQGNISRSYHNHPTDAAPSPPDVTMHGMYSSILPSGSNLSSRVYSFGKTKSGKLRTRLTRFDNNIKLSVENTFGAGNISPQRWDAASKMPGSKYRTKSVEKLAKRAPTATHPAAYAALGPHLQHLVPAPTQAMASTGDPTVQTAPPHVAKMMPLARVILSSIGWSRSPAERQAARRQARSKLVANHQVPLSSAVNK